MVDILLSTYNGEKFLKEQLDSLLKQTFSDYKIIIRDDFSTDSTKSILNEYKKNNESKIILIDNNGENLGSTRSFFELLKYSTSEYIFFCDQDDVWNYDKVEKMIIYFEEHCFDKSKPALLHSSLDVVDENLEIMPSETKIFNANKRGMEHTLVWQIFQNDVTGCTVLINDKMRELINTIDFSSHKIIQHDWFLAQIAYLYDNKFYYPEVTIKYRQHSNNVISAKKLTISDRINKKLKNGISYPFYDQIETLLQVLNTAEENTRILLFDFANLRKQNKLKRIIWHLKHHFLREGNLIYKAYQLFVC